MSFDDEMTKSCNEIRSEVQFHVARPGPGEIIERAGNDDAGQRTEAVAFQDVQVPGKLVNGARLPADGDGPAAQFVRGCIFHDPAAVDDDDVLEQVGHLVDEVRGKQHRPRMLRVVGQQSVVEDLPGHRVEPEVRLVEQGDLGVRGQPDDDPDGGRHAAGQFLDGPVARQREVVHQLPGQLGVPVRVEPGRGFQRPFDLDVGVDLAFLDEDHPAEDGVVLQRVLPVHPNRAGADELLSGDDPHQGGFARTVPAEQTGDGVGLQRRGHVVEGRHAAVAAGDVIEDNDGSHDASPSSDSLVRLVDAVRLTGVGWSRGAGS